MPDLGLYVDVQLDLVAVWFQDVEAVGGRVVGRPDHGYARLGEPLLRGGPNIRQLCELRQPPLLGLRLSHAVTAKGGETVVFSWIVYKSRAHRDRVNAKIMKDPRIISMMDEKETPFDGKRMVYGGFRVLVDR